MRTGTTLRQGATEGLEPLGAFNQPVYKSFGQIRAALLNELGPRYADYFTRPDFDSDGTRIGWVAHTLGEPRRWVDLGPEEQAELEPVKKEIHDGFSSYLLKLTEAPENSPRNNFAKVLTQALKTPGSDHLYFIDRQPMISFWGFKQAGQAEGVDPLLLPPRTVRLAQVTEEPPVVPPLGPSIPVAAELASPWWRWLLWLLGGLLLLLLLLALLWWLLGPRLGLPPVERLLGVVPWHERERVVSPPVNPLPLGPAPLATPGVVTTPGAAAGPGVVAVPGAAPGLPLVPEPGATSGPAAVTAPGAIVEPGKNQAPPTTAGPGEAGKAVAPEAPPVTPAGPQSPSVPKPGGQAALPQPGVSSPPGSPLRLPEVAPPAGPATFMEGLWRSRTGLLDKEGHPLEEYYRFDGQGRGNVTVREKNGTECGGQAAASVEPGGKLVIKEAPSLTCSDGGKLSGAETRCVNGSNNLAGCEGTNTTDGSKFSVQMEKISEH